MLSSTYSITSIAYVLFKSKKMPGVLNSNGKGQKVNGEGDIKDHNPLRAVPTHKAAPDCKFLLFVLCTNV